LITVAICASNEGWHVNVDTHQDIKYTSVKLINIIKVFTKRINRKEYSSKLPPF
jgi:hypothetical protein